MPHPDYPLDEALKKPLLIIIGDSVSNGYGTDYEDIYWVQLQRLLDLYCLQAPTIVVVCGYGNNLIDELPGLRDFLSSYHDNSICGIIYQWNFNDITPETRSKIKSIKPVEGKAIAEWRYKWLNRSVFLRLAQFYSGKILKKTGGTCEERGLAALGPYTWTFGSKAFAEESDRLWNDYGKHMKSFADICRSRGAAPFVMVSPTLFDIDHSKSDPYFNVSGLDFSCATINPLERLVKLCNDENICLINPTEYVSQSYNRRIEGGNFVPYYFAGDDNHFNSVAATYVAEYMAKFLLFDSSLPCISILRTKDHNKSIENADLK